MCLNYIAVYTNYWCIDIHSHLRLNESQEECSWHIFNDV